MPEAHSLRLVKSAALSLPTAKVRASASSMARCAAHLWVGRPLPPQQRRSLAHECVGFCSLPGSSWPGARARVDMGWRSTRLHPEACCLRTSPMSMRCKSRSLLATWLCFVPRSTMLVSPGARRTRRSRARVRPWTYKHRTCKWRMCPTPNRVAKARPASRPASEPMKATGVGGRSMPTCATRLRIMMSDAARRPTA